MEYILSLEMNNVLHALCESISDTKQYNAKQLKYLKTFAQANYRLGGVVDILRYFFKGMIFF